MQAIFWSKPGISQAVWLSFNHSHDIHDSLVLQLVMGWLSNNLVSELHCISADRRLHELRLDWLTMALSCWLTSDPTMYSVMNSIGELFGFA